jgi:hypothetical protein
MCKAYKLLALVDTVVLISGFIEILLQLKFLLTK